MTERRLKGLTSLQEKELDVIKKTFTGYEFTDYVTLARLRQPKIFPYAKKNRLYKDVSEKIIRSWRDIGDFFHYLPESYRKQIVASRGFESLFTTQIFSTLQNEVNKKRRQRKHKQADVDEETLFKLYQTFLRIGYRGLVSLMPSGFGYYLSDQMEPMMGLMRSITAYNERIGKRKRKSFKNIGFKSTEIGL